MEMRSKNSQSWAGGHRLRMCGQSQPWKGGLKSGTKTAHGAFPGEDLLETFLSLVPSPCSPNNLLTTFQLCMHPDTGNRDSGYGMLEEWLPS